MRTLLPGTASSRVVTVDCWEDLPASSPADSPVLRRVTVREPVRLDALEGDKCLHFVSLLRDLQSENVGLDWQLADEALPCDLADVSFLPPPSGGGALARRWQDDHRFGTFYWRAGPGFVVVQDLRRPDDRKRLVLDTPEELACFERHWHAAAPDQDDAAASACVEELRSEGVLLGVGGPLLLTLPMRFKQWPIPSSIL